MSGIKFVATFEKICIKKVTTKKLSKSFKEALLIYSIYYICNGYDPIYKRNKSTLQNIKYFCTFVPLLRFQTYPVDPLLRR